jgi:hypothetical protein
VQARHLNLALICHCLFIFTSEIGSLASERPATAPVIAPERTHGHADGSQPVSTPSASASLLRHHSHHAETTATLQEKLDAVRTGAFEATSNEEYRCTVCLPRRKFSTSATGSFQANLQDHLDSTEHMKWSTSRIGQKTISSMLPAATPSASTKILYTNVQVHICKGYHSQSLQQQLLLLLLLLRLHLILLLLLRLRLHLILLHLAPLRNDTTSRFL